MTNKLKDFKYNDDIDCFVLNLEGTDIYIDNDRIDSLTQKCDIKRKDDWTVDKKTNLWMAHSNRGTKRYLLQLLYPEFNTKKVVFKNENINDYRRENIKFIVKKVLVPEFIEPDNILQYGDPVMIDAGKYAGHWRNMYWLVECDETKYYIMDVEGGKFKFNVDDLQKVLHIPDFEIDKRPIWYIGNNGYIMTSQKNKYKYLHHLITGHNGNGQGITSIKHLNKDKLDNRKENLEIFTNIKKEKVLPKHVTYYNVCYNKKNNSYHQFYRIEGHPQLNKIWSSSKSKTITIEQKLKDTLNKLNELNKLDELNKLNKTTVTADKIFPKYIFTSTMKNKLQLVLDHKTSDIYYNCKMVMKTNDMDNELNKFMERIKIKYGPEFVDYINN
jgi:hypothetical protein